MKNHYVTLEKEGKKEFIELLISDEIQRLVEEGDQKYYGKSKKMIPHKRRVEKIAKVYNTRESEKSQN